MEELTRAPFLLTMTEEPYQPVRIYYQVFQKNAVIGRFKRLRCIDLDEKKNRWVWLYEEEAKNIKFTKSYKDIPKEYRPIVLGSFTWKGDTELRLDVRSFERVVAAIQFFDQKINRRLAKVTKIKIVNKLFSTSLNIDEMSTHHNIFFEQREAVNPRDRMKELKEIESQHEDPEEGREAGFSYLQRQLEEPSPEVEELETNFYEDGIQSLSMLLQMRQIEAMEHWQGNKSFSPFDIVKTIIEDFGEEE
jgi:hypothetical protein